MRTRSPLLPAAALLAAAGLFAAPAAQAKGCLKGAAVGAVAGHLAHHGVLGAAAGCAIGHHEASKHAKEAKEQQASHATTADHGTSDAPAQ